MLEVEERRRPRTSTRLRVDSAFAPAFDSDFGGVRGRRPRRAGRRAGAAVVAVEAGALEHDADRRVDLAHRAAADRALATPAGSVNDCTSSNCSPHSGLVQAYW